MFRNTVQRNKCVSTLLGLSGKSSWCDEQEGLSAKAWTTLERYQLDDQVYLSTSELNIFLLAVGLVRSGVQVNIWYLLSRLDLRNRRVVSELLNMVCAEDSNEQVDAWLEKYKELRG